MKQNKLQHLLDDSKGGRTWEIILIILFIVLIALRLYQCLYLN